VSGTLTDIQIDSAVSPPRQTSDYQLSVNLDANETYEGPFDWSDPDTRTASGDGSYTSYPQCTSQH
jgi:hypothetical protein